MTADPTVTAIESDSEGNVECWCCGTVDAAVRMVQLDNHPEVHLCPVCAHYVHQRAWQLEDAGRRGPAVFIRDQSRNLRAEVMRRGWHHNRVFGSTLRRLGRYLP